MILILLIMTALVLGLITAVGFLLRTRPAAVAQYKADLVVPTLPRTDCGACGYGTCIEFAGAAARGDAPVTGCNPGGPRTAHAIGDIMGVEAQVAEPVIAAVHCKGGNAQAKARALYDGIADCTAAAQTVNGNRICTEGCLGLGSCADACRFDAIRVSDDGVALVNADRCTGCGACVAACPRGIIDCIPSMHKIFLGCASHDSGPAVREYCTVGCTACGQCVEASAAGGIEMRDNLPRLDYLTGDTFVAAANRCPSNSFVDLLRARPKANIDIKCDGCGECIAVCPANAITGIHGERHTIDRALCIGCGKCVPVCHVRAIALWGGLGYMRKESVKKPW